MKLCKSFYATFILFSLGGCKTAQVSLTDDMQGVRQPIVGGSATSQFAGVGVLLNTSTDGQSQGLCTATLVDSQTVLTAAHCVLSIQGGQLTAGSAAPQNLSFYTGTDASNEDPGQVYKVQQVIVPDGFSYSRFVANVNQGQLNDDDIALLVLTQSPNLTPLQLATAAPTVGEAVDLVGYGTTQTHDGDGAGIKRTTQSSVTGIADPFLVQAGSTAHGVCSGDSGGPILHNNTVIGVTQAGQVDGSGNCVGNDYFTRVDAYQTFLAAHIHVAAAPQPVGPAPQPTNPAPQPVNSSPQPAAPVPQAPVAPAAPPSAPANAYCAGFDQADSAQEVTMLALVNKARASGASCGSYGKFGPAAPLTSQAALRCAARKHSADMATRNFFSHSDPDHQSPWARIAEAGYSFEMAAENIAAGSSDAGVIFRLWMRSPGHCANIMNPQLTDLGIGLALGGSYGAYWTQDFGTP